MVDVGGHHSTCLPKPHEVVTWASRCFGNSSSFAGRLLDFVEPAFTGFSPVASCLRSEVELLALKWEGSLFGFLLGKKPHLPSLTKFLLSKWKISGALDLSSQTDGAFLLRFSSLEERNRVLESGPWFVGGRLLVLRPWRKRMKRSDFNLSSVPIWIRLPNLPLEFWSKDSLSRIGSLFGNPLFCDEFTVSQSRTCFARICVEVGTSVSIPNKIRIDVEGSEVFEQEVLVEWRPQCCNICKCLSHKEINCNMRLGALDQLDKDRPVESVRSQDSGGLLKEGSVNKETSSTLKEMDRSVAEDMDWTEVHRQNGKKSHWKEKRMHIENEMLCLNKQVSLEGVTENGGNAPTVAEGDGEDDRRLGIRDALAESSKATGCSAGKDGLLGDDNLQVEACDRSLVGETADGLADKAKSNIKAVEKSGLGRSEGVGVKTNNNKIETLGVVETEFSGESIPPGFNNFFKDKSSETGIHPTAELSESEEEDLCFSSRRARSIREKLGISIIGTGNADKAFAEFCRSRQKENDACRKKSVVPDVSLNLMKQVGKKGVWLKGENSKRRNN